MIYGHAAAADAPSSHHDRIEDLRARALAVRSIDPAETDFSDLEPIAAVIGDARIVQLGESTHGSGAAFAAKVRLIKFLHQAHGFDVLAWESGLYDVHAVNEALRRGSDPLVAARLGIFGIWAWSREIAPLFEYARNSHGTDRPLEMTGFDMQFSGREIDDLERDMLELVALLPAANVEPPGASKALVENMADTYRRLIADDIERAELIRTQRQAGASNDDIRKALTDFAENRRGSLAPVPADLERFVAAIEALQTFLARHHSGLAAVHGKNGDNEVEFMQRVVENLRHYGIAQYERRFAGRPAEGPEALALRNRMWNRRDARMAENLEWLAESRYPGRKIIVWAHNGHIMNAYYHADWETLSHVPVEGGMKPAGAFVVENLKSDVYTVGFTAFAGEYGLATASPNARTRFEAPHESLEALLNQLDSEHVFLNFRALPNNHWLRQPATMSIRGYRFEQMQDWTKVVDGIFFIDRMTPATRVGAQ